MARIWSSVPGVISPGERRQPLFDDPGPVESGAYAKIRPSSPYSRPSHASRRSDASSSISPKNLDPRRLVFIDEAGSHIAMTREHARAPRGERAHGVAPRNVGTVTTMIGALDVEGARAMMNVDGATDAEPFETFLTRVLVRKLKPGDIVVLDNVRARKTADVRRLIRAAGARVLFLPPYSPDPNPIELSWSKLKALLREVGARTRDALDDAIRRAMDLIDSADATGVVRRLRLLRSAHVMRQPYPRPIGLVLLHHSLYEPTYRDAPSSFAISRARSV
jgi:transposase